MEKITVDTTERLRAVVEAVSMRSHAAFARKCGLQPASLSRLLSGEYRLTEFYADKISGAIEGLNRDYLLGKSDYMGNVVSTIVDYDKEIRIRDARILELEHEVKMLKWLINKALIEEEKK